MFDSIIATLDRIIATYLRILATFDHILATSSVIIATIQFPPNSHSILFNAFDEKYDSWWSVCLLVANLIVKNRWRRFLQVTDGDTFPAAKGIYEIDCTTFLSSKCFEKDMNYVIIRNR